MSVKTFINQDCESASLGGDMSLYGIAPTAHSSVQASPSTLTPGQRITITGEAPRGAGAGEWITLESDAFVSNIRTSGIPTIRAQILVGGTYKATATIKPGLRPTTYVIVGVYQGRALDTAAWIKVQPYSSVGVTPGLAAAGQRVTIYGRAPREAQVGERITLVSHAFSSRFASDGIPSLQAEVLADGTYKATAVLRRSLAPTAYTIRGRYKGQPLDTDARISVPLRPRAMTGMRRPEPSRRVRALGLH